MFFTVTNLLLLFFSHLSFCNCKGSTAKKSFVFAARQIGNNLSPIAKKIVTLFLAFCKISLERTSNYLACALEFFLCLFCARFVLLKTGHSSRNLTKKGLKIESFL